MQQQIYQQHHGLSGNQDQSVAIPEACHDDPELLEVGEAEPTAARLQEHNRMLSSGNPTKGVNPAASRDFRLDADSQVGKCFVLTRSNEPTITHKQDTEAGRSSQDLFLDEDQPQLHDALLLFQNEMM